MSRDKVGRTLDERSIKTHSWGRVRSRVVVVVVVQRTSWLDHGGRQRDVKERLGGSGGERRTVCLSPARRGQRIKSELPFPEAQVYACRDESRRAPGRVACRVVSCRGVSS